MTVKELKELLAGYPDDQFVHVRVWTADRHRDVVVDKLQQGSDGAALITCTVSELS